MRQPSHALAVPAALLLALGLAACGGSASESASSSAPSTAASDTMTDTMSDSAATAAAEETVDTSTDTSTDSVWAMDLEVGDCFTEMAADTTDDGETVDKVDLIDCTAPHRYEVYNNYEISDATTLPTGDALDEETYNACYDSFQAYVGTSYEDSVYDVTWLTPTPDSWERGDHVISCLATTQDGSDLTKSVKGSNE